LVTSTERRQLELIVTQSNNRRGIAFLRGHLEIISLEQFEEELAGEPLLRRQLYARMDHWVNNANRAVDPEKYHGWDPGQHRGKHRMCFVFKYKNKRVSARLYGFLCNPSYKNPGFQLFIPVRLADKRSNETDITILDRIARLSREESVVACVRTYNGF